MSIELTSISPKKNKKAPKNTIIESINSTVTIDTIIYNEKKKQEIIDSVSNFIKFKSDKKNIEVFKNLYGYGIGLNFLFHGFTGTGKTMMVYALANYFNMPLYKDYTTKGNDPYKEGAIDENGYYIDRRYPEIIKLPMIFAEAEKHNGIVLLDEADKFIFNRLSHYNYFLQLLEQYSGIVIMTANDLTSLDNMMSRRINGIYEFGLPDEEERTKIWNALIPNEYKHFYKGVVLSKFAKNYIFSGGHIKNIILDTVFDVVSNNKTELNEKDITNLCNNYSVRLWESCGLNTYFFHEASSISDDKISKNHLDILSELIPHYNENNTSSNSLASFHGIFVINVSNISYGYDLIRKFFIERSYDARIIDVDVFMNPFKKIRSPLTGLEILIHEALKYQMLGCKVPTIMVDNDIGNFINIFYNDLKIKINKNCNVYCINDFDNSNDYIDECSVNRLSEEDNINKTNHNDKAMSVFGKTIFDMIDNGETIFLITNSPKDFSFLDNSLVENVFYLDLQIYPNEDLTRWWKEIANTLMTRSKSKYSFADEMIQLNNKTSPYEIKSYYKLACYNANKKQIIYKRENDSKEKNINSLIQEELKSLLQSTSTINTPILFGSKSNL